MSNLQGNVDDLLQRGEHGREVEKLQLALNRFGYNLKPDGRFGTQTAAAVRHMQRTSGVSNDGVVGPETDAAIQRQTAASFHVGADWGAADHHDHGERHAVVGVSAHHEPHDEDAPGWTPAKPDDEPVHDDDDGASDAHESPHGSDAYAHAQVDVTTDDGASDGYGHDAGSMHDEPTTSDDRGAIDEPHASDEHDADKGDDVLDDHDHSGHDD